MKRFEKLKKLTLVLGIGIGVSTYGYGFEPYVCKNIFQAVTKISKTSEEIVDYLNREGLPNREDQRILRESVQHTIKIYNTALLKAQSNNCDNTTYRQNKLNSIRTSLTILQNQYGL
jgi:hypothetical protein